MMQDTTLERPTVNLGELAYVLGKSRPYLARLVREQPDFPVAKRGDKGDAYEFVVADVKAWFDHHEAEAQAAEEARREQLDMYRREMYGEGAGEAADPTLTPQERKQLADAVRIEDYNRTRRGELLERAQVEFALRRAFAELQKGLRQIPAAFARDHGMSREARIALEGRILRETNGTVDRLQELLGGEDDEADADAA